MFCFLKVSNKMKYTGTTDVCREEKLFMTI